MNDKEALKHVQSLKRDGILNDDRIAAGDAMEDAFAMLVDSGMLPYGAACSFKAAVAQACNFHIHGALVEVGEPKVETVPMGKWTN